VNLELYESEYWTWVQFSRRDPTRPTNEVTQPDRPKINMKLFLHDFQLLFFTKVTIYGRKATKYGEINICKITKMD